MKRKIAISVSIGFVLAIALAAGVYFALAMYYKEGFSLGTWLNGVYCTGKSIEQVNQELLDGYTYEDITIIDIDGNKELLSFQELEMKADFTFSLKTLQSSQNPYLWVENISGRASRSITPRIFVEEEAVFEKVSDLACIRTALANEKRSVRIQKGNQGYELVNDRKDVIIPKKVVQKVLEAIHSGRKELDLEEAGCYEDLPMSAEMLEICRLWEKIDKFQTCKIQYRFGDSLEHVGPSEVAEWITLDEAGNFQLDETGNLILNDDGIKAYIQSLAEKYDTYAAVRTFHTTRGDTVEIEGGTYGNKIDQKAEFAYLKEAYLNGVTEIREPVYEKKALYQGSDDIGNTYIEIDMENQKMYYYIDGELSVETPIVTGDMMKRRSTPAAVCFVYGKQKSRILRGPGYASFVNFWMPVKGGIGIHDAPWRKEFGGDIYMKNGSHGCINTPYDAMEDIFNSAEVGTPVIMYY